MVDFIHNNKDRYGVEAICRILPIAASTYYRTLDLADNPEHRAKRDLHDEHHAEQIKRIWKKVQVGMAFLKSGNNCKERLCYCALYGCSIDAKA